MMLCLNCATHQAQPVAWISLWKTNGNQSR